MSGIALITGIAGQDGSYLAELLLSKSYQVYGTVRESGSSTQRIAGIRDQIEIHYADLTDAASLVRLIDEVRPTEIYNLAAQSYVPESWSKPVFAADLMGLGVTRFLDAIRAVDPSIRFYQAGSSEMFGSVEQSPQCELTPFCPRNPYATAKVYAHWILANYRERYGLFACSGILFNHESPRRGEDFVTRKITRAAASIKLGMADELRLGNLHARRDWGYAGDFVEAMRLMLQQEKPNDYVIGTGQTHTVEQFVRAAFEHVGLDWQEYVVVDPKFYRPAEVQQLVANPSKARKELGWEPKVSFDQLVGKMVNADLASISESALLAGAGWQIKAA